MALRDLVALSQTINPDDLAASRVASRDEATAARTNVWLSSSEPSSRGISTWRTHVRRRRLALVEEHQHPVLRQRKANLCQTHVDLAGDAFAGRPAAGAVAALAGSEGLLARSTPACREGEEEAAAVDAERLPGDERGEIGVGEQMD